MGELRGYFTQWNKSEKDNTVVITYMGNLK